MRGATAVTDSHQTAQTRFLDANGVSLAYRRIGPPLGVPLVMLQRAADSLLRRESCVRELESP
jgi:hypothetical protein